jgi:flagellar biosynthesis protein FliP
MVNRLLKLEETVMLQTVLRLLPELPLLLMTAIATHLVMSFCADAHALQARPPSNGW